VRFVLTAVLWLATTLALAAAVPAVWIQLNIVSEDGYAAMARRAATDPALQSAAASELTTRAMALIAAHGGGHQSVESSQVHDAAVAFTTGPSFPPLFADLNRAAHTWLFTQPGQGGDQWVIDLAPMLNDDALQQILSQYHVTVPASLTVPLTAPQPLHQGQLNRLATWGPTVSIGAVAATGVLGLLTVAAARRRGMALTSLGVSALLVGAAGWAGIEVGRRYVNDALNRTAGDIRQIADVMVGQVEAGLHQWLDATLVAGVALVVSGIVVAVLGGVLCKS
jgi:hypothetical protein